MFGSIGEFESHYETFKTRWHEARAMMAMQIEGRVVYHILRLHLKKPNNANNNILLKSMSYPASAWRKMMRPICNRHCFASSFTNRSVSRTSTKVTLRDRLQYAGHGVTRKNFNRQRLFLTRYSNIHPAAIENSIKCVYLFRRLVIIQKQFNLVRRLTQTFCSCKH